MSPDPFPCKRVGSGYAPSISVVEHLSLSTLYRFRLSCKVCSKQYISKQLSPEVCLLMHFVLDIMHLSPLLCSCPLSTGIHPTTISESFQGATARAIKVLTDMSTPVTLADRESLLKSATTSLCSKVCTTIPDICSCIYHVKNSNITCSVSYREGRVH